MKEDDPIYLAVKNTITKEFNGKFRVNIPSQNGDHFAAKLVHGTIETGGVEVNNLGNKPHLKWLDLALAVKLLFNRGCIASRGEAMNIPLGQEGLSLITVEGYVAYHSYNYRPGQMVFRRITPIANILSWAGICENEVGALRLKMDWREKNLPI